MSEIPQSQTRRRHSWLAPIWFVPILAAIGIGVVLHHEFSKQGPTIEITFKQADGLEADKTDLRFRGVTMGTVSQLELSDKMDRVIAEVQLEKSAAGLARQGSKFWIVRPRVTPAGVTGLGTIVSGAYIGVLPGAGPDQDHFEALEQPPQIEAGQRGLEIILLSPEGSFQPGAPVYYHSVKVGSVADSALSEDAREVQTRVMIEEPYDDLVRTDTRFWNAGGVKAHFGLLSGLHVGAESFSAMLEGGIAFATPDKPGPKAKADQPFQLADKPDNSWQNWRPAIRLGKQPPEDER